MGRPRPYAYSSGTPRVPRPSVQCLWLLLAANNPWTFRRGPEAPTSARLASNKLDSCAVRPVVCALTSVRLATSLYPAATATSRWKERCCHLLRLPASAVVSPVLLPLLRCRRPARLLPTSLLALRAWHPRVLLLLLLLLLRAPAPTKPLLLRVYRQFLSACAWPVRPLTLRWVTSCVLPWRHVRLLQRSKQRTSRQRPKRLAKRSLPRVPAQRRSRQLTHSVRHKSSQPGWTAHWRYKKPMWMLRLRGNPSARSRAA